MNTFAPILDKERVRILEKAASVLKTVANPMRLGIIHLLQETDNLTVSEICVRLEAEQSLISHHLSSMKEKGILSSERDGRNINYSLKLKNISKIIDCLENCEVTL